MKISKRYGKITNFVFKNDDYFGEFNRITNEININLKGFTYGHHINNGKIHVKHRTSIDKIIDGIIYTDIHEHIHRIQHKIHPCNYLEMEIIIYNMIGNGKNGWFNVYYEIPNNPKWIKTLNPEYGNIDGVFK